MRLWGRERRECGCLRRDLDCVFEWKGSGESEEKELVGAGWPMMRVGLGFLGPWISNLCCKKTNA